MKEVEEKITNGEISQDAFLSVTGLKKAMEIGEANESKRKEEIMTKEAKTSGESNTLLKAASIPAATSPENLVPTIRNPLPNNLQFHPDHFGDSLSTNKEQGKKIPKKKKTDKNMDAAKDTSTPPGTGIYAGERLLKLVFYSEMPILVH